MSWIQIFEHLHPIDLYNLIRTSKAFRSLLLGRQATAVWEEAFRRHPDIPSCPPDVSLPKWVSLLFGPPTCDVSLEKSFVGHLNLNISNPHHLGLWVCQRRA